MPGDLLTQNKTPYLKIFRGQLVQSVDHNTPNARYRAYELKDGAKGEKWELVYKNWGGVVQGITFKDTDYGEMCHIAFEDAVLVVSTSSRYFSDIAAKLMNVDLGQPVSISPYDFETEDGKKKTGVSLTQGGEKVGSVYWKDGKLSPDFPQVDQVKKEKMKANYWKVYFAEVEAFLIEELTKKAQSIVPSQKPATVEVLAMPEGFTVEDETPEDFPF